MRERNRKTCGKLQKCVNAITVFEVNMDKSKFVVMVRERKAVLQVGDENLNIVREC